MAGEREAPPIVIDLGKTRRKRIRALKRGRGRLIDDVHQVVAEVEANLGEEAKGKEILPVVVLYEKKPKKRKMKMSMFPFFS